jgi:hypothetical protein
MTPAERDTAYLHWLLEEVDMIPTAGGPPAEPLPIPTGPPPVLPPPEPPPTSITLDLERIPPEQRGRLIDELRAVYYRARYPYT